MHLKFLIFYFFISIHHRHLTQTKVYLYFLRHQYSISNCFLYSGVHGALMVYEVRFTSEFLASLLSISSSKTLLRRHLSTHFKELVGKEVVQAKRELEVSPGYIPLTTTAKIKVGNFNVYLWPGANVPERIKSY